MNDEERLLQKLRRIEALHAGATTAGEREAAAEARRRIQAKLQAGREATPLVEYRFSLENTWSRRLFLALLRRYGLRPYRYPRQRVNTVMVRLSHGTADDLWSEFRALDEALREHLDQIAERVIRSAISEDTSEAEEVRGELGAARKVDGAAE